MDFDLSLSLCGVGPFPSSQRQAARSRAAAGGAFEDVAETKGVAGNAESARRRVGEAQAAKAEGGISDGWDGGTVVGCVFFLEKELPKNIEKG